MDDRIIADPSILVLVQDGIEAVLRHFASAEKLVKGVRSSQTLVVLIS